MWALVLEGRNAVGMAVIAVVAASTRENEVMIVAFGIRGWNAWEIQLMGGGEAGQLLRGAKARLPPGCQVCACRAASR